MTTAPVQTITTVKNGGTQHLYFFDGLNTDYVVVDGDTVLGHATTWRGAAVIQCTAGGRIRLNGRDFVLHTMESVKGGAA